MGALKRLWKRGARSKPRAPLESSDTLSCFVARKFKKRDVDSLYAGVIEPACKEVGLRIIKLPKPGDSEEITTAIEAAIHAADVVLADLTYGSQNVYYEVGLAERPGKGLVLTCRADHLDEARVKFDLSTRPILSWRNPSDTAFKQALIEALDRVRMRISANRVEEREAAQFSRLPTAEQIANLKSAFRTACLASGYTNGWLLLEKALATAGPYDGMTPIIFWKPEFNPSVVLLAFVVKNLANRPLAQLVESLRGNRDLERRIGGNPVKRSFPDQHIFVCTTDPTGIAHVREVFPGYVYDEQQRVLVRHREMGRGVARSYIHLLAGVTAPSAVASKVRDILDQIVAAGVTPDENGPRDSQ